MPYESAFPERRDTFKDFVFGICFLHGVMQYAKGVPLHLLRVSEYNIRLTPYEFVICMVSCNNIKGRSTPFNRFCRFLLSRHKRNRRKKKTSLSRRAAFYASIFAPLSADCESSAYLVFGFAEWFRAFSLIIPLL